MLHHGDCLDVMAGMDPESVDAIVTDPPYGLEFMGKEWDRLDAGLPQENVWKGRRGMGGSSIGTDDSKPGSRHHIGYGGERQGFKRCTTCGKRAFSGSPCTCLEPTYVVEYNTGPPSSAVRMQRWHGAWAEAALRVAKPSAYLLAFGGTRTVHRMTCALEDAGWIIRDLLVWAYASGFPKSKASLKPAWEPIVLARKPGPLRDLAIDACRIGTTKDVPASPSRGETQGYGEWNGHDGKGPGFDPSVGRWPANVILTDPIFDGGWEGVVGGGEQASGKMLPTDVVGKRTVFGQDALKGYTTIETYGDSGTYSRFFQLPGGQSCDWCGASLAASSSSPPSPSGGSVPDPVATVASPGSAITMDSPRTSDTATPSWLDDEPSTTRTRSSRGSRLAAPSLSPDPANNAARSETSSGTIPTTRSRLLCASCAADATHSSMDESEFAASRNYPRWFLVPKADRADREPVLGTGAERVVSVWGGDEDDLTLGKKSTIPRRNVHPTVKPTELMRHLVRLVTPSGGVVLDPFLGSGTTALAAEMEGFAWVGIEREAEYVRIAEARLNGTQRGLAL